MPLIQVPDIGRKLQQKLRLTFFPDSVLAIETVPVIVVEDLSATPDDVSRGCMGSDRAGPVVAEFPIVGLFRIGDPPTYALRVTKIHMSSDIAMPVQIVVPTAGLSGLTLSTNTSFTDFNTPGRPTSRVGFDTQAVAPAGRDLFVATLLADTTLIVDVDIRLGSFGVNDDLNSLMVIGSSFNARLRAGFEWEETPPLG